MESVDLKIMDRVYYYMSLCLKIYKIFQTTPRLPKIALF